MWVTGRHTIPFWVDNRICFLFQISKPSVWVQRSRGRVQQKQSEFFLYSDQIMCTKGICRWVSIEISSEVLIKGINWIDTVNQHLRWYSFNQHSIDNRSRVNLVPIKCWLRVSINTPPWMPLVHNIMILLMYSNYTNEHVWSANTIFIKYCTCDIVWMNIIYAFM